MGDTEVPRERGRWRFRAGDLGRAVLGVVGAALGFVLASWLVPGFDVGGPVPAVAVAVLVGVFGFLLRPVLVWLAVHLGLSGVALVGLFGQAVVIWLVTSDLTHDSSSTLLSSLLAAWVVAAVSMAFAWVATAGTEDAVTAGMLRRARRRPVTVPDPEVPGVVFIQADGCPTQSWTGPCARATLPTLSRWIRSGSHRLAEWRPMLPATTPASRWGSCTAPSRASPRSAGSTAAGQGARREPARRRAGIEARHSDGGGCWPTTGSRWGTCSPGTPPAPTRR